MGLIDAVRSYVTSGPTVTTYRCAGCDATFESAKPVERARCPECLDREVAEVGS